MFYLNVLLIVPFMQKEAPAKKTKAAAEDRAQRQQEKREQYKEAEEFCAREGVGSRACITANPHLNLINHASLQERLTGKVVTGAEYSKACILTKLENDQLVQYLIDQNAARNGQSFAQIADKVQDILKVHQARNRLGGRGKIALSPEASSIASGASLPSKSWFLRFFAKNKDRLSPKVPHAMEAKRAAVANEETVEEHFNGVYGLIAELKAAGIMDEEGVISDPRRILNRDETGQFVDYNSQKGNAKFKVAAGAKAPALTADDENRDMQTCDMTIGLDGFVYHCHLLLKRSTITDDLIPEDLEKFFTGNIYEEPSMLISTKLLLSTTDKGVQVST